MTSISASGGVLSFKPKSGAYFYETFPCQQATSNGYNSITFSVKGPASGSFTLEIQTKTACSAGIYSSKYTQVTGLTGNTQTITVPLSQFSGANANAITGFVWSGFSSTSATWQLSNIAFGCGGSSGVSSVVSSARPSSSAVRSSSAVPSSSAIRSSSTVRSSSAAPSSVASSTRLSSSTARPSSTVLSSSVSASRSTLVTVSSPSPSSGTCEPLLIDDWISQSRLTFLFYNAMNYPTSTDDSVTSITVGKPSANRVEIVPKSGSYFYSQFPCVNAKNKYTGISLRIKAPRGATLSVELDSSDSCDPTNAKAVTLSSSQLGWTFDGTEKLYLIPFAKFSGLNTEKLVTILFSGFSGTTSSTLR